MAQPQNQMISAALAKAGITRGANDSRGVVGRVGGGSSAGQQGRPAGGPPVQGRMEIDKHDYTGEGGKSKSKKSRKSHGSASNPYSAGNRPSRPALVSTKAGGGRSASLPTQHGESSRGGPSNQAVGKSGKGSGKKGGDPKKESDGGQGVKTLKEWLGTRKRGKGLVDLSAMANDPILLDGGLKPPGHPDSHPVMGDVVWKVVSEDDIQTHTVSLRENTFANLKQLAHIGLFLPHIRALDLSGNPNVSEMIGPGGVEVISCHPMHLTPNPGARKGGHSRDDKIAVDSKNGLKYLKEIMLTGCRVRTDAERHGRLQQYIRDMILRFPNLTLLDGQPVPRVLLPVDTDRPAKPIPKAQMEQLTALPYTWPFDVQPKWADNPEMGGLGSAFLAKFFQLFDMDRNQLLPAYAPNATLAISYTTVVPPRARLAGYIHTLPNQKGLNFDKLARTDSVRNLLQRTPGTWRRSLLVANDQDKLTRWLIEDLPKTRHPLSEEGKWMYDVIGLDPVNGVGRIMLIVNGEFTELPSEGVRSFTRTFVIAESPSESPAAAQGWPGVILSDTLVLRQYSGYSDFSKSLAVNDAVIANAVPQTMPQGPLGVGINTGASPAVVVPPEGISPDIASIPNLTAEQMSMVAEVQRRTNLITNWAADLSMAANFDLAAAGVKFGEMRGQIPPECYRR